MSNAQGFSSGDLLVFQIESGFGLLKVLGIDETGSDLVWHIRVYRDLFPEIEFAEMAIASQGSMAVEIGHIALTDRAFESTQVARLANRPLSEDEMALAYAWNGEVSDRSIRLTLGLR